MAVLREQFPGDGDFLDVPLPVSVNRKGLPGSETLDVARRPAVQLDAMLLHDDVFPVAPFASR